MSSGFDGAPLQTIERQDGRCCFWAPVRGVLLSRTVGYLHHEFSQALIALLTPMLQRTDLIAEFHDWSAMDGYDVRCQADLTSWHALNRSKVACLHILCDSNLVRMGVAVANVPLRGLIRLHHTSSTFDNAASHMLSERRASLLHA